MKYFWRSDRFIAGLAIFSMFFGASTVVLPLAIGRYAGDKSLYAFIGFIITALLLPFVCFIAMLLFDGDYYAFFGRLGEIPGKVVLYVLMGLIGPFALVPKSIVLSYATIEGFVPALNLFYFTLFLSVLIYFIALKRKSVIRILGRFLGPLLLVFLGIIVVSGFITGPSYKMLQGGRIPFLLHGVFSGLGTTDLFAAFFFSALIVLALKQGVLRKRKELSPHTLIHNALEAGVVGLSLLLIVYAGFMYVAAFYGKFLGGINHDELISFVAFYTLGSYAGLFACVVVALAALTTALVLTIAFSEFLHRDVLSNQRDYKFFLLVTTIVAFIAANTKFLKISDFFIVILYFPLVVLALVNIAYKIWGFKPVKGPFYGTMAAVLVYRLLAWWF